MMMQDTEFQSTTKLGQVDLQLFPSLEAECSDGSITPNEIAFMLDQDLLKTKAQEVRRLKGKEAKTYYTNSLPCVCFSVLASGNHSGLICLSLKLSSERINELAPLMALDPVNYMLILEIAERGLHYVFKANAIDLIEHVSKVHGGVLYTQQRYGLTDEELAWVKLEPDARVVLSKTLYTNFDPKILPDTASTVSEGQSVRVDSTEKPQMDTIREGIHAEQQQAQEQQANQTANPKEPDKQPGNRPTVGAFPVEIFSESLQAVIEQTGLHMNFRADWIGAAILYAICVAVGNCYGTRYKKYEQKASMYLAIVGEPGTNKSAPFQYALAPLQEQDDEWYRIYKDELADYTRWSRLNKKDREAEGLPADREAPIYKTLLVSDVTQEFLVQTHAQNPIGFGLFMDELAGWLKNFTRYSNGSEEQFWLSVWSLIPTGSGRKGSGVNKIPQPLLPVGGTIQPGVLSELSRDGRDQNGFIDRLLFAYPDSQVREYDSETELDSSITTYYKAFVDKLLSLRDSALLDEKEKVKTIWLPFADDAFIAMRKWKNANTDAINKTSVQALKGLLSKLDMYCIRFALMIELMDWACDQLEIPVQSNELDYIRLTSVERAIILTDYFRQNAEKVYHELNEQTPDERLPSDRQRLFKALPDEVETGEAVTIATELEPPVSESTVKRMLKDTKLFKRVGYGEYAKVC